MTRAVRAACLLSLAIGLFFIFVQAPHPWGWNGFDNYHELALALASGKPFPTIEVPWGYTYFLAAFYCIFGDRPWIPLVVQVVLNATTPLLLFTAARRWTGNATASLAALLLGAFSFNTVYASTQSSDAICTVLFLTTIVVFMSAVDRDKRALFVLTGLVTGVMSQFRPNLILIPALLAAYAIWKRPVRRTFVHAALLLLCAGATLTPWVIRNYRLTRMLLPTSVHGSTQLWYGTLQVGPYLDSRVYNPRSVFEWKIFDSTSLDDLPILVTGRVDPCAIGDRHGTLSLVYWTDIDPARHRLSASTLDQTTGRFLFEVPPPGRDAVYYYYFETAWPSGSGAIAVATPPAADLSPSVYFVTHDQLGDLDRHADLLDVFDVARLARHEAWGEPVPMPLEQGGITSVQDAVESLLATVNAISPDGGGPLIRVDHDAQSVRVVIGDSAIRVPRTWNERITDLTVTGPIAETVMHAYSNLMPRASRQTLAGRAQPSIGDAQCGLVSDIKLNAIFYRAQPQAMRRYSALAFDNIRREPAAFLMGSLYRVYRVFVVMGSRDKSLNQQFRGATAIYAAATVVSVMYLGLFLAGIGILWRRGADILLPLLLILYIPATIAPLLTNMRYSVTVQPLMFVFVAAAIRALIPSRFSSSPESPRTR